MTQHWWLLAVGAACVLAAWYYTGGKRPYGYAGLGEVSVFVFFGLVAVCGTVYVQVGQVWIATLLTGVWVGALACAILVANNLRDIVGDAQVGKRTLATRLGDTRTRALYVILVTLSALMIVLVALLTTWWALVGLAGLLLIIPAVRVVLSGGAVPRSSASSKPPASPSLRPPSPSPPASVFDSSESPTPVTKAYVHAGFSTERARSAYLSLLARSPMTRTSQAQPGTEPGPSPARRPRHRRSRCGHSGGHRHTAK